MNELYDLKMMLCEELEQYGAKGDLSTGDLEVVDKLTHTIKNLIKIIEACEDEEYSGNMSNRSYGNSNRSYRSSRSNRSYQGHSNRRDSMGRYAGDYARAAEDMASQLHSMAADAPDEKMRREIERLAEKCKQM